MKILHKQSVRFLLIQQTYCIIAFAIVLILLTAQLKLTILAKLMKLDKICLCVFEYSSMFCLKLRRFTF